MYLVFKKLSSTQVRRLLSKHRTGSLSFGSSLLSLAYRTLFHIRFTLVSLYVRLVSVNVLYAVLQVSCALPRRVLVTKPLPFYQIFLGWTILIDDAVDLVRVCSYVCMYMCVDVRMCVCIYVTCAH
jgi:hypothetical protein